MLIIEEEETSRASLFYLQLLADKFEQKSCKLHVLKLQLVLFLRYFTTVYYILIVNIIIYFNTLSDIIFVHIHNFSTVILLK